MQRRTAMSVLITATLGFTLAACGGGAADDPNTISVAYHRYGNTLQVDQWMQRVKQQYEQANPGKTVKLDPVVAPEGEYLSKLQLRMRSPSTAPDVLYEDSFNVNSDVAAGYLEPLDDRLAQWPDWEHYIDTTKQAGKAADGKTYGVPLDTDTRGLWYNRELFAQAGLPADWRPRTWDDVLAAARQVKQRRPDAIAMDLALGKAEGESVSMQTVEMLLYGTETGTLHDGQKWIAPSKGFADAMGFLSTALAEGLTQSKAQIADAQYDKVQRDELARDGKVAIRLDGSFASGNWQDSGWQDWARTMSATPMPTQHGQAPGTVTLSGGWTLAISSSSEKKDAAFEFIKQAMSKDNVVEYTTASGNLPAREDAAADPRVLGANPLNAFWIGLLDNTHYRPALPEYPKVSQQIQQSVLDVVAGRPPDEVADQWSQEVSRIVQPANTRAG
ncbi:extracellular solute-binding protein [Saccharopolyspora indica]|uniref:extracellular solute-binding protein n=1 Tax=Saccharopolyspora indica TaxID=1229659 RepID=UPI0022EB4D7D|nr:extracellular solute-binding protein [Saccharopolyspora indica]MDA3644681.1 extracellular solute-binding protein [Saccharopolyspora indica]